VIRPRYLVDVSVITRLAHSGVAEVLGPLLTAGVLVTCGAVDLALYAQVRELSDLPRLAGYRDAAFTWLPTCDGDLRRAVGVQALLAADGHRLDDWAPLVVAAVAQRHEVTVLHYNRVFDVIAKATEQPAEWVVAAGSLERPEGPRWP
jgi:predicted nucleic acid-binding protein